MNDYTVTGLYDTRGTLPSTIGMKNYPTDITASIIVLSTTYIVTQIYIAHNAASLYLRCKYQGHESLNFFTKTGAYDGKTTTFKLKKLTSQPQEFIITTFFRNGGSASPYDSHMLIHINLDGNIKVLKMYGGTGINVSFDSSENALVLTASRGYMSLIVQSNYNFSIIAS